MVNLFLGDLSSILSTALLIIILAFIIYSIINSSKITNWRFRIIFLAITGLLLCIFAATRDNYVLSVQGMIDGTGTSGIFSTDSFQSNIACLGGAIIAFLSLSGIFVRNEKYRKIMFFILSSAIIFKACLIEISKILIL